MSKYNPTIHLYNEEASRLYNAVYTFILGQYTAILAYWHSLPRRKMGKDIKFEWSKNLEFYCTHLYDRAIGYFCNWRIFHCAIGID